MRIVSFSSCILFIVLVSCNLGSRQKHGDSAEVSIAENQIPDPHSQSNAEEIRASHVNLDLTVDFDVRQIIGSASWEINPKPGVEYAVFDTFQMEIDSVHYGDGLPAEFSLGTPDPILGTALKILLKPDTKNLTVYYKTGDSATALQWMTPEQTFGKVHPYLYTQGETIHTRSWVPCPDSPGARFTYEATVRVPEGLLALMSAENPQEKNNEGIYYFKMNQKIPAYLMALAAGDIAFKPIDDRTGVYSEPAILEKSYSELEDVGTMVHTAEKLYGPYRWDRYDVLILPSGFPIGGMENPRLTFATPTILAGDKSLVNLIAHELAHSWSGNLVTNATWNDFWLNEGFTMYFERRITEEEYGEDYVAMLWGLGERTLRDNVRELGENSRRTWLKEDLDGRNPDEGFTYIPYEKGAAFVLKIEQTVGRENLDAFLIEYFNEFAFRSMTTENFLKYLNRKLLDKNEEWKKEIDADAWIYQPGIPANYPEIPNARFEKVDEQVAVFLETSKPEKLKTDAWSTYEWLHFLAEIFDEITVDQMARLDASFKLTSSQNSEIADLWFLLALQKKYTAAYPAMKEFLYVTGREKFLVPLYSEMMKSEEGRKMAAEIYSIARPNYHPISQNIIDAIVKP